MTSFALSCAHLKHFSLPVCNSQQAILGARFLLERLTNVMSILGESQPSSNKVGDAVGNHEPRAGKRASAVPRQLIMTTGCSFKLCILLMFVTIHIGMISAQNSFTISSTSYSCSANLICIGEAHASNGNQRYGIENGRLSLLNETYDINVTNTGIAYYKEPVKLLDYSAQQPASFNTSFTVDMRYGYNNGSLYVGDGMTFVISADNFTLGAGGGALGFFNAYGTTSFKSIIVEFDTYWNGNFPSYDISYNHVSLDFSNITWRKAKNASDVNVTLSSEYPFYSWVEYSNDTQLLEVRVSSGQSRPIRPLLSYKVNLFNYLEEYMWVGFSSGSGLAFSNYYIGEWKFESWFGSSGPPASHKSNRAVILGISIAIPVAFLACVCIIIPLVMSTSRAVFRHFRLKLGFIEDNDMIPIEGMPERFTYKQLSIATGNFNIESKLGQGGFGSVYRGVLPSSGRPVAVKKISSDSAQGEKEFMAEVCIISQLRHRNLIQLLGWCRDTALEKYLIVYELMPNASLDKWLFPRPSPAEETICLSWQQRFNIVSGTAAALDYLHQGCKQQVIHRDVKASNIMLDEEWNAKLGDFGLARLVDHQHAAATTGVAGTYGYIAPETAVSGHFTDKPDVFAFGAVVLEVACGRRAFSEYLPPEEMSLVDWVWGGLSEGNLHRAVDTRLEDYDTYWMEVVLILGLLCSHPNPSARPSMKHVGLVLAGDAPVPSIPSSKPDQFSSELQRSVSNRTKYTSRSGSISLVSTNFSYSSGTNARISRANSST